MNPDNRPPGEGKMQLEPVKYPELTQEEIEVYKKCNYGLMYKVGIPLGVLTELLSISTASASKVPVPLIKRCFRFFAIATFTPLLFSPICYRKLIDFHEQNVAKKKSAETHGTEPINEAVTVKPDDFSYPVDSVSNLNESEPIYSSDFSAPLSGLLLEEEKSPAKPMSYEELRMKNRSQRNYKPSPRAVPSEPPSDKKVRRNKYGDEIE